jgi:hypothetical protein
MPRHAQRHVQGGGGQPVRWIGGEHDPLGRHAREQLDHVEREEAGGVVQHARMVGQPRGEDPLVADRAVRQDQDGARMAQGEIDEALRERRQTAAGVDQDRHAGVFGEGEHIVHVRPSNTKSWARGWSLMPRAPLARQRSALGQRAFGGVQAAEGREPPSLSPAHPSTRSLGRL